MGGGAGAPEGKVVLCARESAPSVSMLGNCVMSLRMLRSTDVSAEQKRLLT